MDGRCGPSEVSKMSEALLRALAKWLRIVTMDLVEEIQLLILVNA